MKKLFNRLEEKFTELITPRCTDKAAAHYAKNLYRVFFEHKVTAMAAQMSFFLLLCLFPFLLLISSLLSSSDVAGEFFGYMLGENASSYLSALLTVPQDSGGGYTFLGSIVVLYSVSKSLMAFSRAFDTAYEIGTKPRYLIKLVSSMIFVAAFIALIVVAVFVGTLGGDFALSVMEFFGFTEYTAQLLNVLRYVFSAASVFFSFVLIYKWLPSVKVKFKDVFAGAALCTGGIAIFSVGFSVYASYSFMNSPIQSTIGTVMLVLLWLYITSIIIILGAELNSLIARRKS